MENHHRLVVNSAALGRLGSRTSHRQYSSFATPLTERLVEGASCWKTYEFCCRRREQSNIPCPCWLLLHSRALREMGLSVQNALKGSPPSEPWRHRVVDWEETISVLQRRHQRQKPQATADLMLFFLPSLLPGTMAFPWDWLSSNWQERSWDDSPLDPRIFPKTKEALKDNTQAHFYAWSPQPMRLRS